MIQEESGDAARRWSAFCDRLYAQNQFAMKLGLEAMRQALSQRPGPPRHEVILVAGTNGKGTTSSSLSALLTAHGLRVGLYTSPHLVELTERFRVGGRACAQAQVLEVGLQVMARHGEPGQSQPLLTFFELTTLMAIELFDQAQVDVAIYEVGLGGRLDATNALDPVMSLITTLGYDHQQLLGETLTQIAAEKAAICRAGRAAIIGPQEHEEAAQALRALCPDGIFLEDEAQPPLLTDEAMASVSAGVSAASGHDPIRARHQRTARVAAQRYVERRGARWDEQAAQAALGALRWHGRFDRRRWWPTPPEAAAREADQDGARRAGVEVILDAAHNADGAAALERWLRANGVTLAAVVFGAMADKELSALGGWLGREPWADVPVYTAAPKTPRAAKADALAAAMGRHASAHGEVEVIMPLALQEAQRDPAGSGALLVFGSIYLLGEVMAWAGWSALDIY